EPLVAEEEVRADAVEVFRVRCASRAKLWHTGQIDLHSAVDELQHSAEASGLRRAMTDLSSAAHPPNSTAASTAPARDRSTFVRELRPEPGVDLVLAIRALLKIALRRFGLRCVAAHENLEEQR